MISDCKSIQYISSMQTGLLVMLGSGRQGKSCTLHSLLAICFPDREKYFLDPLDFDVSIFKGYHLAHSIDEIPIGAVVIIEDVNRVFHSRGSAKDPTLQRWLGIISHRDNIVCITTQSSSSSDLEFFRSQDVLLLFKKAFQEDLLFERPEHRPTHMVANEWIDKAVARHPDIPPKSWTFIPRWNECISVPKVSWWTTRNSVMFRECRICS